MHGAKGKCARCGGPTECVIGSYWSCAICDSPHALPVVKDLDAQSWHELEWEDEDTNPGWPAPIVISNNTVYRTKPPVLLDYKCIVCNTAHRYRMIDVANGARCSCGGMLMVDLGAP